MPNCSLKVAQISSSSSSDTEELKTSRSRIFACIALSFCFTGSQIGAFTIGPGLTYIAAGLGVGDDTKAWIPNSASLAGACIVPCIGYIQDMVGRRVLLAIGLFFTLLGTILFGTARAFDQAIAAQVLSGVGSAIQELTAVAAIAELIPIHRRGIYLAVPPLLSSLFGPAVLYANLLSTYASWRWLLWISLIWNAFSAVFCALTYFRINVAIPRRQLPSSWRQFDYVGNGLIIAGFALMLVALNSGGIQHPWTSAYVLGTLITGICSLVGFVLWELSDPPAALAPLALFRGQRVVALAFVIGVVSSIYYTVSLNLAPTIVQDVFELSPTMDGVLALGPGLGLAVGAGIANVLLSVFKGHCWGTVVSTCTIMMVFTAAEAAVNPLKPAPYAVLSTLAGIGVGATILPITTWITFACPQDLIGTAVSLIIAVRSLAGSVGYTVLNNIYTSQKAPQQLRTVHGLVSAAVASPAMRGDAHAARIVYLATIPLGFAAVIAALCLPDMSVYVNNQLQISRITSNSSEQTGGLGMHARDDSV